MRKFYLMGCFVLATVLFLSACGPVEPTPEEPTEQDFAILIVGSWAQDSQKSYEELNNGTKVNTFYFSDEGIEAVYTFNADGSMSSVISAGGETENNESTYTLDGNKMVLGDMEYTILKLDEEVFIFEHVEPYGQDNAGTYTSHYELTRKK